MFEAYSEIQGKIISINDALDYKERYYCPNPKCSAQFTIRGITGDRTPHFARLPSTPHVQGCMYEHGSQEFIDRGNLYKFDLDFIIGEHNDAQCDASKQVKKRTKQRANCEKATQYISTPKQLLKYCVSNSLDTEYLPNLKVNDIILDSRNLLKKGNLKGINGLRILVAHYDRPFPSNMIQLRLSSKTKNNKEVYLRAWVRMSEPLYLLIEKYLDKTYISKGIATPPLAIMANWHIEKDYLISCHITERKQIILL